MIELFTAHIIWAFSFGLIKTHLSNLEPGFISAFRLLVALLIFLPFFKTQNKSMTLKLLGLGAIQFGLMYVFYLYSFHYLKAYEVALFTVTTPLLVVLFSSMLEKKMSFMFFLMAFLSSASCALLIYKPIASINVGLVFVTLSNICFALAQVFYQHLFKFKTDLQAHFSHLFLGGFLMCLIFLLVQFKPLQWPTIKQTAVLFYLGVVASGIGFFLFNKGATRVSTGVLSVFNNIKIPMGVLTSLIFFNERPSFTFLILTLLIFVFSIYFGSRRAFLKNL